MRRASSTVAPGRRRITGLVCGAVLLSACGGSDADGGAGREPAPLAGDDCLVIVLDALSAELLGCYGGERADVSPTLDALAEEGVRFTRAWSNTSWTLPSTASLHTGLYQETHGLHIGPVRDGTELREKQLVDEAVTLAELFAAAGYDTACYTQNPWTGHVWGFDQGFDAFHEWRGTDYSIAGWQMAEAVAERSAQPADRPRFTYVHFRRPHTPFDPPADQVARFVGADYDGPVVGNDTQIEAHNNARPRMSPAGLAHHRNLYLANIAQADASVARLLEGVDRSRTLVVVLSDHGEALDQHGRMGHNWHSYQEYVSIPFLLAHPAFPEGRALDVPVLTIDLAPTLVELFGLDDLGAPLQGRSLAGHLRGGRAPEREAVFTSARIDRTGQQWMAVFDGRHKYLRQMPSGAELLFDLTTDPGELHDLAPTERALVDRLAALLGRWRTGQTERYSAPATEALDPESLAALRALGYLK